MGWSRDSHPWHEGYLAGYVEREGLSQPGQQGRTNQPLVRELIYPTDDRIREDVLFLGAACTCGWRSPFFRPDYRSSPPSYSPYTLIAAERDEDRAREAWNNHIDLTPT